MRIKSQLWVAAYLRRCLIASIPAAVVRRGDADAGAIFIKLNLLDGSAKLYCPAPGGLADIDAGRRWLAYMPEARSEERDIDAYLARQRGFDEDLWIIEIEDRKGRHLLDDALLES